MPVETIIAGVDFSGASRAALHESARLARQRGAALRVVHVLEHSLAEDVAQAMGAVTAGYARELREQAGAMLQRWIAQLDLPGRVHEEVVVGSPVGVLVGAARAAGSGLLVVGTTGTRHTEVGVGTVAASCIRHSPLDVMAVRADHDGPFARIVACTDFSETADRAAAVGAEQARRDQAELHVLHVWCGTRPSALPWFPYGPPLFPAEAPDYPEYAERVKADRQRSVDAAAAAVRAGGISVRAAVVEHPEYDAGIREYVREVGADLVVLGTRGRTNLRDIVLGSTAERLLRRLPCSALAVRPPGGRTL